MTSSADPFKSCPLLRFSIYTSAQSQSLERVGVQLLEMTSEWDRGGEIKNFNAAYDLFWLWLLGAYEVLRTLAENQTCFSSSKRNEIVVLKRELADIRMPFAKQQLRGNQGPIYAENSVVAFDDGLVFEIDGNSIQSNVLIRKVIGFLHGFSADDILAGIPTGAPQLG